MTHTVIIAAARTALGSFQGALSPFRSTQLGGLAIKAAVERAGIDASTISEVIMGCVLPAGLGQAPARQAAIAAGLPNEVSAFTVNKVCSSGLLSVMLADRAIRAGDASIVVAGGMESMTNAPYLLPQARAGYRMGDGKVVDCMVFDGLWDIYNDKHMGLLAEMCAAKYGLTRQMQDDYAINSYKKAQAAGAFKDEIVPVAILQKKGEPKVFDTDEGPGRANFDKMLTLKPSFQKDGTVTAANASAITDGAAALVVASSAVIPKAGKAPMARIIAHATCSHEPEWFTTAPIGAIKKVLTKSGLTIDNIDVFEINEAFAVVPMAAIEELAIDPKKVNLNGGAIALGHPIGASGARILTTLIYALRRTEGRFGLATLCNGGGEGTAMVIERV